jgi:hypothetical protein
MSHGATPNGTEISARWEHGLFPQNEWTNLQDDFALVNELQD